MNEADVREHIRKLLDWGEAHAGFEQAVKDLPKALRGTRPAGLPHSPWELVEHLRITQHDILDFCRNPKYQAIDWPSGYWPASPQPADGAWEKSIAQFVADRRALQELAADTSLDLAARIPHGDGQTYLRELLLVADHTSYHVGQLILVRRLLGAWKD